MTRRPTPSQAKTERRSAPTAKTLLRASVVALAMTFTSSHSHAEAPDPFWGPDKALHFVAAGALAGAGYGVTTALSEDRGTAFAVGAGAALGAGALKEGLDAAGLGDPSWKDFAWDVIGAACGLGVAWLVDTAVRGADAQPLSRGTSALSTAPARLQLTF